MKTEIIQQRVSGRNILIKNVIKGPSNDSTRITALCQVCMNDWLQYPYLK